MSYSHLSEKDTELLTHSEIRNVLTNVLKMFKKMF